MVDHRIYSGLDSATYARSAHRVAMFTFGEYYYMQIDPRPICVHDAQLNIRKSETMQLRMDLRFDVLQRAEVFGRVVVRGQISITLVCEPFLV
jgi:hypothetical protein